MKKILFLLLMGLFLLPSESFADYYEADEDIPANPIPIKLPTGSYVNGWIDSYTGVFTITSNSDILDVHISISQNGVLCDEFTQDLESGVPTIYNFNGYAEGEYILVIENANYIIAQYRIKVLKD